jgi:hypothetical protein
MPYVPCRECLAVVPYVAAAGRRPPRLSWRLPLVLLSTLVLTGGCGGSGGGTPDPRREKYEADKARCEAGSPDAPARKSCMTYRGWPDGKFR